MTDAVVTKQAIQDSVQGAVFAPGDAGYDEARFAWSLTTDHHPALVLVAETVEDVAAGVRYAAENDLGVAVQSTGHGQHFSLKGDLLIRTSKLNQVSVDASAQTATAGAGAQWGDVLEQVLPHGLAPLLGSAPHVGVVGYSLGGGIGWLGRKYGYAADSIRWIELVTPDGVIRRASATENQDLFWGLRGGGGNFGVVTALEFDLYPVASVYGGNLYYNGDKIREALLFFRDWVKTLPEEMTSTISVVHFPSLPMIPEVMRGLNQVLVRAAYVGDPAVGEALIKPWLDWNKPTNNTFRDMPFSEIAKISNDPVQPTGGKGSNALLDSLSDGLIDGILAEMTDKDSRVTFTEIRHAGGALSHPADNAISNRDVQFFLNMAALAPVPEMIAPAEAGLEAYKAKLQPHLQDAVYLNFLNGKEATKRVTEGYTPENLQRLQALKAKYDPQNLFRFSYQLAKH